VEPAAGPAPLMQTAMNARHLRLCVTGVTVIKDVMKLEVSMDAVGEALVLRRLPRTVPMIVVAGVTTRLPEISHARHLAVAQLATIHMPAIGATMIKLVMPEVVFMVVQLVALAKHSQTSNPKKIRPVPPTLLVLNVPWRHGCVIGVNMTMLVTP
jgi:hypothetical protein